jgi:glycosyltransferase involved in cell wall biosynthesis
VKLIVADGKGNQEEAVAIEDVGISRFGRLGRFLFTTWKLFFRALRSDVKIIHFHDPELIPQAYLLALFGRQVIFDMHENVPKQIANKPWLSSFSKKVLSTIYIGLERLTLSRFHVVYAESSYRKDYSWLKNTSIILNLPDVSLISSLANRNKYDNFTVGYIGGCSAERGVLRVASAMMLLRDNGVMLNYLCIGPQSQEVEKDDVFVAGVEKGWIDAPGRVNATVGWPLVKRCSVGMAVLEPLPNYIESWPTKMFEYLAMGLPVIVSDFPMYKAFIEEYECGLCVDPHNLVEISVAIKYLFENPKHAMEMGKKGREAVFKKYNWQQEEKKLIELYQNLCGATH